LTHWTEPNDTKIVFLCHWFCCSLCLSLSIETERISLRILSECLSCGWIEGQCSVLFTSSLRAINRIDSHLVTKPSSTDEGWERTVVISFFSNLSSSRASAHLPMSLSPLCLVNRLVESNYLIEASTIYWKILQLPQASFRNDTASLVLRNYLQSSRAERPFYLSCLPEVEAHEWGW
jgi:hypothetical protein